MPNIPFGRPVVLLLMLSLAMVALPGARAAPPALGWQEAAGESVALLSGERVVWRFNFAERQNKPYFHPLAVRGGPELTWDRPPDHVWHHGLWLSWKEINGLNYWEIEPATGKPAGRTQWSDVRIERRDDFSARLSLRLAYVNREQETVLREERTLEVSPPDDEGGYAIDWLSKFTAEAERVKLDRTPLPGEPGGVGHGGYAGLSLRLVSLEEREATTPEGPVEFGEANRVRLKGSPAFDYSGTSAGSRAGIAVLVHPTSLNSPSPWYAIRTKEMTFFSPAVICFRPHEMARGESFSLRYRVCVHAHAWSAERLGTEYRRFISAPGD